MGLAGGSEVVAVHHSGPMIHVFEDSQAKLDEDGLTIGAPQIRFEGLAEAAIRILGGPKGVPDGFGGGPFEARLKGPSARSATFMILRYSTLSLIRMSEKTAAPEAKNQVKPPNRMANV